MYFEMVCNKNSEDDFDHWFELATIPKSVAEVLKCVQDSRAMKVEYERYWESIQADHTRILQLCVICRRFLKLLLLILPAMIHTRTIE